MTPASTPRGVLRRDRRRFPTAATPTTPRSSASTRALEDRLAAIPGVALGRDRLPAAVLAERDLLPLRHRRAAAARARRRAALVVPRRQRRLSRGARHAGASRPLPRARRRRRARRPRVAVVNETFARRYFAGPSPRASASSSADGGQAPRDDRRRRRRREGPRPRRARLPRDVHPVRADAAARPSSWSLARRRDRRARRRAARRHRRRRRRAAGRRALRGR